MAKSKKLKIHWKQK